MDDSMRKYADYQDKCELNNKENNLEKSKVTIQVESVRSSKSTLVILGKLFMNSDLSSLSLVCIGRKFRNEYLSVGVPFKKINEFTENENIYKFRVELNFEKINNGALIIQDIYDLYLKINEHDSKLIRIGKPTFKAKHFISDTVYKDSELVMTATPYYTFKKSNLSLDVEHYSLDTFKFLRRVINWSWLIRLCLWYKNIWIVGEQIYKAQDTGYVFFRYLRNRHPNKNAYYVIDPNCVEAEKVIRLGNELEYRSKKHILYIIGARRIISSHHPDYLFPSKMLHFKNKIKAKKIFLQHGILGTKNMRSNYGNFRNGFKIDEFIVSSNFEKQIVINDLGYKASQVHVTGLSRFDDLFNSDTTVKRQLLIIPTWRDWITTTNKIESTEYFKRYKELITNENLIKQSKEYGFSIVFCLHPNMQLYSYLFESVHVKVINQGEISVQKLLKESSLMITDYSSVGFDFSFLDKPVIYYQFDQNDFLGKDGSHINLVEDLPGEIYYTEEEIIKAIKAYCGVNFVNSEENMKRTEKLIKYKDQSSCDRIFEVVENAKKSNERVKQSLPFIILKKIYKKLK